ncbi:hypothetical protein L6164_010112 [Bauhinia variegata]|uniref:Uncharacterized protein n=1 Tax=Bauhinia variegata TaxID=167791 RepID=A0ACB9PNA7_BAUVA|nr:hypothetical protein L6164_010112 [Bauhinia variegata]
MLHNHQYEQVETEEAKRGSGEARGQYTEANEDRGLGTSVEQMAKDRFLGYNLLVLGGKKDIPRCSNCSVNTVVLARDQGVLRSEISYFASALKLSFSSPHKFGTSSSEQVNTCK